MTSAEESRRKRKRDDKDSPIKIRLFPRHAAVDALSWLLTGAMVLLVMLFSVVTVRGYGRETIVARQIIEEKGSMLIRALESSTRVGMGMHMRHTQLQALLKEMAWQPGVLWFAVTDENGRIIAHSNPQQVDNVLYSPAQMREFHVSEQARWRWPSESQPALGVHHRLRPFNSARGHHTGMMNRGSSALVQPTVLQVASVAFDSRGLDVAQARGQRSMMIMLGATALVIAATILAQFQFRCYHRSRQQLLEAMARKEKLVALGHLAADVAHEIRNPPSSIKGLAKYFAERTPPGGEARQLAQVMTKEADRLNRVVSELLELVWPAHSNYQSVDINVLIRHSLQLASQDTQSRGIALQFTPCPELTTINADVDRLNQVLLNLYLNAMQAVGRDNATRVSTSEADCQRVEIVVMDSGKGMSDEELQVVFTPHFTTKADDTGLRLAVVQNTIEQHGGTIRAESQPGVGVIFTSWLPVEVQRREDEQR